MSSPLIVLHPVTGQPMGTRTVLAAAILRVGELSMTPSGATVSAPPGPFDEACFAVGDGDGGAIASPITINGNGRLIEGAATFLLNVANQIVTFALVNDVWRQVFTQRFFQAPPALPIALVADGPGGSGGGGAGAGNGQDAVIPMADADYALTDAEDACSVVRFTAGGIAAQRKATWKATSSPLNKRRIVRNETAQTIEVANAAGGITDFVGPGLTMLTVFDSVGAWNAHTAGP